MPYRYRSLFAVTLLLTSGLWPRAVLSATIIVDIEARIDELDQLIIRDGTLQWEHLDDFGAAVGRAEGNNWPTIISTSVDGVPVLNRYEWFPQWSAAPPNEIRQPELSSVFTGLMPSVAGIGNLTFESIKARDVMTLVQRPHIDNSHTTVVQFYDGLVPIEGSPGDDWYHARLTFDTLAAPVYPRPQVVRWEIAATLTDIVDLNGAFPGVLPGDPVRGVFKYDAGQQVDETLAEAFEEEDARYYFFDHPLWFELASVVIENPRTGDEFYLAQSLDNFDGFPWSAAVFYDGVDTAGVNVGGGVQRQMAGAEPGLLFVDLIGPGTNFPGIHLPTELRLEDWPLVELSYVAYDQQGAGEVVLSEQLEAEIYSLTPITTPIQPGDYNYDDIIDNVDQFAWRASFGNTVDLFADGNLDGSVNAADYVLWRKAYELSLATEEPVDGSLAAVPEPQSAWRLVCPLVLAFTLRRRPSIQH